VLRYFCLTSPEQQLLPPSKSAMCELILEMDRFGIVVDQEHVHHLKCVHYRLGSGVKLQRAMSAPKNVIKNKNATLNIVLSIG